MVKRIVVASNNQHKIEEIKQILQGFEILKASDIVEQFEAEENGRSFCENALIKAKALKQFSEFATLADDSGLEVFALDNKPGIYSARYALTGRDEDNVKKLLEELKGVEDRAARFVCCMVIILPDGEILQEEGYVYGSITTQPYGKNGFGYDPVFMPEGYNKTFAQMSSNEKNSISHRRRALERIYKKLKDFNF